MKTPPDKTIAFTFGSHPTKDPKLRWQAVITFPPGSVADTVLPIRIVDGENVPVAEAVFEFAGRKLAVKEGQTSITYADFIAGKHSVSLWLHRKGTYPVPGGLTFA